MYRADIAALQLTSPVPLASLPHVAVACLPGPDLSAEHVVCEAPGWGYDAYKTQVTYAGKTVYWRCRRKANSVHVFVYKWSTVDSDLRSRVLNLMSKFDVISRSIR